MVSIDSVNGVTVEGREFLTTRQACEVTEHSRTSFLAKVKREGIVPLKRDNGRTYYPKDSLRDAISRGVFIKWA